MRQPAMAGRFYPADAAVCRAEVAEYFRNASVEQTHVEAGRGRGGIVPHAGWVCSAAIAGQTIAELASLTHDAPPSVVVVFGAVHTPVPLEFAALDNHRAWATPTGLVPMAFDLSEKLAASPTSMFVVDERFHRPEHAVEVELPLIQAAWPDAEVLPIEVPLVEHASIIGRETAQRVLSTWRNAVFLASSDFTHYGPNYRFTPAGIGKEAIDWAMENDRRVLRLITDMATERIVPEVRLQANACGGGAIAATMAACLEAGASKATLLRHTNSYQTLAGKVADDPSNAVGYASVVFT